MMNILLFGAAAQIKDPIKKSIMTNIKTLFTVKAWYTFPQVGWSAVAVSKYADTYQLASDSEWKSSVMRGLAV